MSETVNTKEQAVTPSKETRAQALKSLEALLGIARKNVKLRVLKDGRIASALMEQEQRATHGLAWLATYVEASSSSTHMANDWKLKASSVKWKA